MHPLPHSMYEYGNPAQTPYLINYIAATVLVDTPIINRSLHLLRLSPLFPFPHPRAYVPPDALGTLHSTCTRPPDTIPIITLTLHLHVPAVYAVPNNTLTQAPPSPRPRHARVQFEDMHASPLWPYTACCDALAHLPTRVTRP